MEIMEHDGARWSTVKHGFELPDLESAHPKPKTSIIASDFVESDVMHQTLTLPSPWERLITRIIRSRQMRTRLVIPWRDIKAYLVNGRRQKPFLFIFGMWKRGSFGVKVWRKVWREVLA